MKDREVLDLQMEIKDFLHCHNKMETYHHCTAVGEYAYNLAEKSLAEPNKAKLAGLLHDISAIYPNNQRIDRANKLEIQLCKEEIKFPMIIHQKISRKMALDLFKITDSEILSAIECHTTLKGGYSDLDLVVFVADKIKWDQAGEPPYLDGLMAALDQSLEHAAYYYIEYLLSNDIKVIHPWLMDAYRELTNKLQIDL
ncbi:bis(5'-nucleosyl)-tetraphosphatase (symmetrical) YqeK [Enterococcus wangshanyuanii]|uniref:bis(5'-nucleosyl)-tetraphosphatase (symmetrical) n=1 Tax=Enterococcus wangshanyuanii TaxID=2005703 RepID=A0ABQ1NGQ1_9ENTE|nr:bis(5'-nucleosyl)-tetraphosphatase (symmetrical) YqeK [Enterococcus wangshanyuanii]GGC76705.1 phosphohydrolase [Enterococcus wangshanyuanii]